MPINTREVARRPLSFSSMDDLPDDLKTLHANGDIEAQGNWTPSQVVEHVTLLVEYSVDGFPIEKAPLMMRMLAKVFRGQALNGKLNAGYQIPATFKFLEPDPEANWDDVVARLENIVARIDDGEKMSARSPVFGSLSHEEWTQLHCRHAEMHFGFLKNV